ncbi:hypothetical protein L1987_32221 [Smallanthus sonchifolius]|uniref:Uncharacterized protein n=1 Tax=Smallanthus sonchifolius TaxID=185202 RepID=A0ACB9I725_9ASTR|nr:hypothetical protein L1987_32221 [Smallanthus sonchifolius]
MCSSSTTQFRSTAARLLPPTPPDAPGSIQIITYYLSFVVDSSNSDTILFVADGVFFAKLKEVLTRELAEDSYSSVKVRVTPMRTEIIISATRA